jgi:D-psicose/D-tagatose/L-ribulose 3-epimerase
MKIGICNELFEGWPIEEVFEYAAALGYDGVELAPFTLAATVDDISEGKRRTIRRAAAAAGIEIVGLHWLLVQPEGMYINHPDEEVCNRTRRYLEKLVHLCAELSGSVLVHGSPKQRSILEGWDPAETWKRARRTFEACSRAAEGHGVYYCLEPLSQIETNFINTVDEALRMVHEIAHPNLRVTFDCRSASHAETASLPQVVEHLLKEGRLGHVHLNDSSGRGPGFGELKFLEALRVLRAGGYRGYASVEVFDYSPDPATIAARSGGYIQGLREALD